MTLTIQTKLIEGFKFQFKGFEYVNLYSPTMHSLLSKCFSSHTSTPLSNSFYFFLPSTSELGSAFVISHKFVQLGGLSQEIICICGKFLSRVSL